MAARIVSQIEFSRHAHTHRRARTLLATPYHCKCGRSLEYYDSESVFPEILTYTAQRPPMEGSRMTDFPCSFSTKLCHNVGGTVPSWKIAKKVGSSDEILRDGPLKIFFRTSISRKRAKRFLRNFHALRVSFGPIYGLVPGSVGVQISRAAGVKVAKNGMSDCGWIALGGSLPNCATDISNIFASFVRRDIWQHRRCIFGSLYWRIKKLGAFKKLPKMAIFGGWFPRQGVVAESFSLQKILTRKVCNWRPPSLPRMAPLKFLTGVDFWKFEPILQKMHGEYCHGTSLVERG